MNKKEKTASENQDRFRELADSLPVIIVEFDNRGEVTFINKTVMEMFGYAVEEFYKGKDPLELLIEVDRQRARENLQKRFQGISEGPFEYTAVTKDGQNVDILIRSDPVMKEDECVGVRAVIIDNTERKKAEESLRESEEKMRLLVENVPDIIVTIDSDAKILAINRTVSGIPISKILGTSAINFAAPEFHPLLQKAIDMAFQNGTSGLLEVPGVMSDKKHVDFELRVVPVKQHDKIEVATLIATDITERKKIRAEKKDLQERLHRAEKMEAIGLLAGGVAHDLNNILAGIVSYPDLLLHGLPEDSRLRSPLQLIQSAGERAAAVVEDLLTISKTGFVNVTVVNINTIIQEYMQSLDYRKVSGNNPNITFTSKLKNDLLNTMGSEPHLFKAIANLVLNASEAMPGGGTITLSTKNRYVDKPVRGYSDVEIGDYVVLSVADEGQGIKKSDLSRIFEPFYTKKMMGRSGTGLGLAVVWNTIHELHGFIDVKSTAKKGTRFDLYLPATHAAPKEQKEKVNITEYKGKGETVLIIDDDRHQRDIAAEMLLELGYNPVIKSSGEDAVDFMSDNSADILLLDMIMVTGIDGLDTYKRILEFHPHQKAIITSGYSETTRTKKAQKLGAGQYIRKPYNLKTLAVALRSELEK
jgi:PAS domain S-box-containing protein